MQTRLRLWEMHPYRCCAVLAPGGVHSEHDLEERSDAQIIVSRFTFRWKSALCLTFISYVVNNISVN